MRNGLNNKIILSLLDVLKIINKNKFLKTPVTIFQVKILLLLLEKGKLSMKELSVMSRVEPPTMTEFISKLISKGMVKRDFDPLDRRMVFVSLTKKGMSFIENVVEDQLDVYSSLINCLDTYEKKMMCKLLQKIIKNNNH